MTPRTHSSLTRSTTALLALVPLVLVACGDDDDSGGAAAGEVPEVTGAWARTSPAAATAGAAYLTITSGEDDALVGAHVDTSVAATTEIHETVAATGDTMTTEMGGGMMEMRPVDAIELPAGEVVTLEPGGYHVMLLDLAAPLTAGQTFDLTLDFRQAPDETVTVEVRDDAP